jgi:hypothetical protein
VVGVAGLGAEMDEGVGSGHVYQFGAWVNASLLLSSSCDYLEEGLSIMVTRANRVVSVSF